MALFSGVVLWLGLTYPTFWNVSDNPNGSWVPAAAGLLKLVIAAAIGALVTAVAGPAPRRHKSSLPVTHAQILFCVAGALIMIIIGDSLARAFGALGATSTVRFRTPMKDPQDATVLFLLIGLGMSVGRGILAISAVGTLFLCVLLWILNHKRTVSERGHEGQPMEMAAHARE